MSIKILNIETSTQSCSVCLSKNDEPWITRELQSTSGHAEKLTLFVQEVLKTASMSLQELDAIAVSQGPGSYTGLRIGVSTAKGLCYALDKPLIAVDTLQAMALAASDDLSNPSNTAYVVLMDARRMDAYVGIYNANNVPIQEPYFCTLEASSFDFLLKQEEIKQLVFVGDAAQKFSVLLEDSSNNANKVFSKIVLPSATYMAKLSSIRLQQKQLEDIAYFEPFYLKKPNITKPKQ